MWDLSSLTRDRTHIPCIVRQILYHWTIREVPGRRILFFWFVCLFIYLLLAVLGLCCCARAFSSCGERGLLFIVERGLLIVVASHCGERALGMWASVVVARRL